MEVAAQSYATPPPNYDLSERATNGFSHSPSPAQIISYLVIASSIAIYFSAVLPLEYYPVLLALYVTFGIILVLSSALATFTDPTDRIVYYYKWTRHTHTISFAAQFEKILFCEYCDSYCWANSKHCRVCNRCVKNFDHHCMWFNNCVGDSNYKYFFISILSCFSYALTVVVHVALASFNVDYSDNQQFIRVIFSWIIGLTLAIFGFLLLNLILLHIYLKATDQTTYQFLQRKKKEEEEELKKKEKEKEKLKQENLVHSKSTNQILPVKEDNQGTKNEDIISEDSIAKTKEIHVHQDPEFADNEKTKRRRQKNSMNGTQIMPETSFKQLDDSSAVKINQSRLVREHEQQTENRLPQFLRKNKSITFLLSSSEAEYPSRKRLEPISLQGNMS